MNRIRCNHTNIERLGTPPIGRQCTARNTRLFKADYWHKLWLITMIAKHMCKKTYWRSAVSVFILSIKYLDWKALLKAAQFCSML